MRKNKKEGAQNLKNAVAAQQRALATLAQATDEKIKQTNAHIAANSAQIVENARKVICACWMWVGRVAFYYPYDLTAVLVAGS